MSIDRHKTRTHLTRHEKAEPPLKFRLGRIAGVVGLTAVTLIGGIAGHNMLTKRNEVKPTTLELSAESAEEARRSIIAGVTAELAEAKDHGKVTAISGDTLAVDTSTETFTIVADTSGKLEITHAEQPVDTGDTAPTTTVSLFVNKGLIPTTYKLNPDGQTTTHVMDFQPSSITGILQQLDTQSMKPSNEPVSYTEEQHGNAVGASFTVEIGRTKTINVDGSSTQEKITPVNVYSSINGELQQITKETAQTILNGVLDLEAKE